MLTTCSCFVFLVLGLWVVNMVFFLPKVFGRLFGIVLMMGIILIYITDVFCWVKMNSFEITNKGQLSATAALQQLMAPNGQNSSHHRASEALGVRRSQDHSRKSSSYFAVALWPLPRLPNCYFHCVSDAASTVTASWTTMSCHEFCILYFKVLVLFMSCVYIYIYSVMCAHDSSTMIIPISWMEQTFLQGQKLLIWRLADHRLQCHTTQWLREADFETPRTPGPWAKDQSYRRWFSCFSGTAPKPFPSPEFPRSWAGAML